MDLTNKSKIKNLLKTYNAKPEKYLGQHFILSKKALNLMIKASEIKKDDVIIEIGPGLGTLTQELAKTGANVVAIEKDPLMVKILKETLMDYKNIKIIQSDAKTIPPFLPDVYPMCLPDVRHQVKRGKDVDKYKPYKNYKIVANLPYNTATFLIRQWLELNPTNSIDGTIGISNPPELMVLMIQKEVAQRICAKPPKMNLLAVSTQFYAIAEIIKYVPKEMFWPKPKVDAAIIKITPKIIEEERKRNDCYQPIGSKQSFTLAFTPAFFKVIKAGFSQPRKQLINNLSKKLGIPREKIISIFRDLKISEHIRAENLSLKQWQNLASRVIHN